MANMQEDSQFLKLENITGPCEYDDFKESFIVSNVNIAISGQDVGRVPAARPFGFQIECGNTHLAQMLSAVRNDVKIPQGVFTQVIYIKGERKPSAEYTMKNITLSDVNNHFVPGSGRQMVSFAAHFEILELTSTDYKPDGSVLGASGPLKWDFTKGKFSGA